MGVEGAEDGAFGGFGGFGVVDCVDEKGEAKDVGEQDEFLEDILVFTSIVAFRAHGELTCRTSLLICPTLTRKSNAAIHSLVLKRTSLAKSCRWVTKRAITYLSRSSGPCELITIVFSVILSI